MTRKHIKNTAMRRVNQLKACWVIFHGFLLSDIFFKINFFEKFFREYHLSVKHIPAIIQTVEIIVVVFSKSH